MNMPNNWPLTNLSAENEIRRRPGTSFAHPFFAVQFSGGLTYQGLRADISTAIIQLPLPPNSVVDFFCGPKRHECREMSVGQHDPIASSTIHKFFKLLRPCRDLSWPLLLDRMAVA